MPDDEQTYLILEYVAGEQIDIYCARFEINVEERVWLFLNVLAAVCHAHSHLIVHRGYPSVPIHACPLDDV
jgi:eukaryotic-like serine/threonine-protein kinase